MNKSLVRFTVATLLAIIAEWTFFVGGLVYAFDKGGAGLLKLLRLQCS